MTPDQEARDALASGAPRTSLSMGAQLIYDRLVSEGAEAGPLGGATLGTIPFRAGGAQGDP
jgi:hypothetical protein